MHYKYLLLFLLFLPACIKQVDIEIEPDFDRIVVNSVFGCYEKLEVKVSSLQSILDTSNVVINDAIVVIEINDRVDTLEYNYSDKIYQSKLYPSPGDVINLKVCADEYQTALACDTMPLGVGIIEGAKEESITIGEDGFSNVDYAFSFYKNMGQDNYYEFFIVEQSWRKRDSTYWLSFFANDVIIDPLILSSNSNGFNFCTYLFNDFAIDKGLYTVNMKMNNSLGNSGKYKFPLLRDTPERCEAIVLRTVSQAYYKYRNSWVKHVYFQNNHEKVEDVIYLPLVGEPQEMYSNVKNGYGVFVAYNQDYVVVN